MFLFLKSLSRTVHEEHHEEEEDYDKTDNDGESKSLTVWRKSLILSCNGFTVIDSKGNLVYRVDNYCEHPNEIILMDGSGKSLLTIYRRKVMLIYHSYSSMTIIHFYYKIFRDQPPYCNFTSCSLCIYKYMHIYRYTVYTKIVELALSLLLNSHAYILTHQISQFVFLIMYV